MDFNMKKDHAVDDTIHMFAAALSYFLKNKPRKNLTQAGIGKLIGCSQSYIGQLSRGEKGGSEFTRRKIAAIYGYDGSEPGRSYDDFIKLGHSILFVNKSKEPGKKPVHSSTKVSWKEETAAQEPEKTAEQAAQQTRLHIITTELKKLVDSFHNKELAYEIIKYLFEIEKQAPEKLDTIKEMIAGVYNSISRKKTALNNGNQ